jgi:hypothetical protein
MMEATTPTCSKTHEPSKECRQRSAHDVEQWCCSFRATSNNPHNNQSSISDCNQPVSTSTEATSSAILARPNALTIWHTALVRPTWAPIRRESMSKDQRGKIYDNLKRTQQSIGVRQWIASVGHCKLPNRQFAIDCYSFFFDEGQQRGETIRQSVEPHTPFLFGWLWRKIVEFICWERVQIKNTTKL